MGHAYRLDLRQIKLCIQLCQHFRQGGRVMEQRIALTQSQLTLLYGQKTLFGTNNLSGRIKNRQRGCIVTGINAQRIAAHSASGSCGCAASSPCSRATAPSRPLMN